MSGFVNVMVFIGILIVLIVLHEFGHMLVAKWSGMRVERFSVFMGRPLWSFTRGETEYGVGWLPIGGYVKITGMTRDELVRREYDPQTGEVISETPEPPEVQARAYCNSTTPRKLATIFAGPLANVIVAVIAFAIAFWVGVPQFDQSTTIRSIAKEGAAQTAGLQPGDRILSVNGVTPNGADPTPLRAELERNVGKPVTVQIERDGATLPVTTPPLTPDRVDPSKGRLGFEFGSRRVEDVQFGFARGLREGVEFTGFLTVEQVKALGRLLYDQETREQVSSVVGITASYNDYAGDGFGQIMRFVGIISLILAIMNLIPLLPLDGGHIVFALFERLRGKRLNIATYQRASVVGIALVGILFIYALNNDIGRLMGEGFRP